MFTRLGQRCTEGTNDAEGKVFPLAAGTFADIFGCRLNDIAVLRRDFSVIVLHNNDDDDDDD